VPALSGAASSAPLDVPRALAGCDSSGVRLCLNGGRDSVEGSYKLQDGRTGPLHFVALTASSGYFTFDDANDVQAIVKVLDECSFDPFNSYWVFVGALTDQEVDLTVTDSATGRTRSYGNPLKHVFAPIQDTAGLICGL
jgi:hypothetical protein